MDIPPAAAALPALTAAGGQQLLVIAPRQLQEAQRIIEAVRENQTVVLHTAQAEDGEAQRLIDFACGGIAAIGGQVHRIDNETFLFSSALAKVAWEEQQAA